jgi:hypothetical protein
MICTVESSPVSFFYAVRAKNGTSPFTADMLKPGDRYELSNGHAVYCAPAGGPGARGSGLGFKVIDSDVMSIPRA